MANESMSRRMMDWMRGRNGSDELGMCAVGLSFVLLVANFITGARWLSALALVFALYACWRTSSTKVAARRKENRAFLDLFRPLVQKLSHVGKPRETVSSQDEYSYFSCPSCGQRVRVPVGKGRIRVTCPRCQQKFDARS